MDEEKKERRLFIESCNALGGKIIQENGDNIVCKVDNVSPEEVKEAFSNIANIRKRAEKNNIRIHYKQDEAHNEE